MRIPFSWLVVCAILLLGPASALAQADEDCLGCHQSPSSASRRQIDGAEFQASTHGQAELACLDCHLASDQPSHQELAGVTPVACNECHEQESLHGKPAAQPAGCADCHGSHGILSADDPGSTLHPAQLAGTCGACHPDQAGRGGFWPAMLSFRIKGHSKADLAQDYSEDRCLDCHQGRAAHGEMESLTEAGCQTCHDPDLGGQNILGGRHGTAAPLWGDAVYLLCLAACLAAMVWGWVRRIRFWRRGGPENRWDRPWTRFTGWLRYAVGQRRVFDRPLAGASHLLLAAGVVVPLVVVIVTQWSFFAPAVTANILSLLLEIAGLGLLVGVATAIVRRLVNPGQFPRQEAGLLAGLILLALIGVSGFMVESFRLALTGASWTWAAPVGGLIAQVITSSALAVKIVWRIHFLLVLAFLALWPYTRLRHIVTAGLNIYFRNLGPQGRLTTIPVDEGQRFGLVSASDLTWKGLLDADACLSCGRCEEVCPAHQTEKPLSPMKIIQDIRDQAVRRRSSEPGQNLIDGWISEEEVWACTTCQACQQACPVMIEHADKIVGLRRGLVLNEGRLPPEAARLLRNLEVFGDPSGQGQTRRQEWFSSLQIGQPPKDDGGRVFIWIGCQGAFHPRAQEAAQALLQLARRSGQSFRLLGAKEWCCGDPARRLGQEALFQRLARRNIASLRAEGAQKIVVFCPHCYNTLAHEYPDLGGRFEVISAAEWALSLLREGRLKVKRGLNRRITFHDPCYLGRIGGFIETPRASLAAIEGLEMIEMVPGKEDSFCCGAGGGRMWLHESGLRVNQVRAGHCLATGAEEVVTACPYCLAMLEDGLASLDPEQKMPVSDLLEVLEWVTR